MKRVIVLIAMALSFMSFTETPNKFSGECKFFKNPPITYQYGVSIVNPNGGGGICIGDVTTYWSWGGPYRGWIVMEQTITNVYCYYP